MGYVLDWERLADALKRVAATGISVGEAKQDICGAIADRKIRIRFLVATEEGIGPRFPDHVEGTVRYGEEVDIPTDLKSGNFSWKNSRPLKPWWHRDHPLSGLTRTTVGIRGGSRWHLKWIELFRTDVTKVLCGGVLAATNKAQKKPAVPTAQQSATPNKHREQPQLEGDDARARRARQWRGARIGRFAERQRYALEWINFGEVAEWCAKEDRSIVPNKQKYEAALETLANDLLAGEYEESGRSRVLYLHPASKKARMSREWLRDAIEHNYDNHHGRSQFLPHCWMPSSACRR